MIGIFDSGIGGLTYIKELRRVLPQYDFIYLGDTARVPYGTRGPEIIQKYAEQDLQFLLEKKCELIIVACNTVSSVALRHLQQTYPKNKILGILIPAVERAIQVTRSSIIGVVGTTGTINSNAYRNEIHRVNPQAVVHQKACPLLVPLVEEGLLDKSPITRKVTKNYIRGLKDVHIDTLILGCTHYPMIEKTFQRLSGKRVTVINSSRAAAEALVDYLKRHPEIEQRLTKNGTSQYFLTDVTDRFRHIGEKFLGQPMKHLEKAVVE